MKILISLLLTSLSLPAATFSWDGSESSDFSDVDNWGFANPPTTLSGQDLGQDDNGANAPVYSSGSLSIGFYRFGISSFGANQSSNLTLNGGSLSTSSDFEVATGRDNHTAVVDISNGSVLDVGANLDNIDNSASGTASTFTINVLSGGTVQGVNQIRGDVDLNVSAGTFEVGGTVGSASSTTFNASASWLNNDSDFVLSGTGQVVFDVFGVGQVDTFSNNSAAGFGFSIDLTGGSVVLALDSGYDPMIGDSFDVLDIVLPSYYTVSAANVQDSLITGGANAGQYVEWDTSLWESDGILSVGSVVPEPSSYALLVGILGLGWVMVRRRR